MHFIWNMGIPQQVLGLFVLRCGSKRNTLVISYLGAKDGKFTVKRSQYEVLPGGRMRSIPPKGQDTAVYYENVAKFLETLAAPQFAIKVASDESSFFLRKQAVVEVLNDCLDKPHLRVTD